MGAVARELDLPRRVSDDGLRRALAGVDPSTAGVLVSAGPNRVPGFDLTFSAPKSVSVLFGIGDERLQGPFGSAHGRAVEDALGYLERSAAKGRRGHDGLVTINRHQEAVGWIDRALELPGADTHSAARIRALCFKAWALWPLGRGAEQPVVLADAETSARAMADPGLLSQVLHARSNALTSHGGDWHVAEALAHEALEWARVGGDEWWGAMAAKAQAMVSENTAELRQRVDRAASLLGEVGNVFFLANLLASAAYTALCLGSDHDAREFVRRAIPLTQGLDNPYFWMLLRGNDALAALFTNDVDAAREAFSEELTLCRELVVRPFASEGLAGLAATAAVHDDLHRAARLYGAAGSHRYGEPEDRVTARLHTIYFEPARTRHGADAWDNAAAEGTRLSFEEAIAYALEETTA